MIQKVKHIVLWTYVINGNSGEEIIGTFYQKDLEKTSKKKTRIGKVIKKKETKLYVKWRGYAN